MALTQTMVRRSPHQVDYGNMFVVMALLISSPNGSFFIILCLLELCAIIIHRGRSVHSGHYYAYIQKNVEMETEITEPDGETRVEKKSFRW